jgi:tetratricopeptide (TPR) repeat protein
VHEPAINNPIAERNQGRKIVLACAALLGCLLLCYANSFHAAWQYDDFGNIINNTNVHMTELSWPQIKRALNAGLDYQIVSRPLAYLSFALNYRFGETEVLGYHVVNFIIHWLASFFLFLFVRDTLKLPLFNGRYEKSAMLIALLSAILWAIHPIQVTAVTYIVQRMASLAGLWYILAMYCYLKARRGSDFKVRAAAIIWCALSILFALLTKENSVLLLLAILLYDIIFIQGVSKQSIRQGLLLAVGGAVIVGIIGLLYTDPRTLLEPYANRPFSMGERLLTQPRVMFIYLSLLAVPMTSRMTILHDLQISNSILEPWTTAWAIGGLGSLMIILFVVCRKYPLISYCGLFFFLNHLVEGSVFNLEMMYEHRNYIPSMLIFVPIVTVASRSAAYFHYNKAFQAAIWLSIGLMVVSIGYTTSAYNRVFKSELTLWEHAVQRAPHLSLAYNNLGNIYWNMGQREQAHDAFKKAFDLDRYHNLLHKALVYYNLGLYAADQMQDYSKAFTYFQKAKNLFRGNYKIWYQTARMQIALKGYSAALTELSTALGYWPLQADFYYLSGLAHIKQGHCADAIQAARQVLRLEPQHIDVLPLMAQGHRCEGGHDQAITYWEKYITREPMNLFGILALIELYESNGPDIQLRYYLDRIRDLSRGQQLDQMLEFAVRNGQLSPYVPDAVRIKEALLKRNQSTK